MGGGIMHMPKEVSGVLCARWYFPADAKQEYPLPNDEVCNKFLVHGQNII
jgi:hypothetical protein